MAQTILGANTILIPIGTTAQRPASGNTVGMIRFNTDLNTLEKYTANGWSSVSTQSKSISMAMIFGG